jgi:hypothetical protein
MACGSLARKLNGMLYQTFRRHQSSSETIALERVVQPFHPIERNTLANDVCNVRKYRLALGVWQRKKLRQPMIEPSARDFTRSLFRALRIHWSSVNSSVERIAEFMLSVSR